MSVSDGATRESADLMLAWEHLSHIGDNERVLITREAETAEFD